MADQNDISEKVKSFRGKSKTIDFALIKEQQRVGQTVFDTSSKVVHIETPSQVPEPYQSQRQEDVKIEKLGAESKTQIGLQLDKALKLKIKIAAAEDNVTFSKCIVEAVEQWLINRKNR